ncbi:hypothetical protein LZ30DRAFT_361172 [Colletotrichum cereale]|nr:hypothetical protein LZ30DRAFT_361172 [Colletotrichum cereale]
MHPLVLLPASRTLSRAHHISQRLHASSSARAMYEARKLPQRPLGDCMHANYVPTYCPQRYRTHHVLHHGQRPSSRVTVTPRAVTATPYSVADVRQNTPSLPSPLVALQRRSRRLETQPCSYSPTYTMGDSVPAARCGGRRRSCYLSDAKRSTEPCSHLPILESIVVQKPAPESLIFGQPLDSATGTDPRRNPAHESRCGVPAASTSSVCHVSENQVGLPCATRRRGE